MTVAPRKQPPPPATPRPVRPAPLPAAAPPPPGLRRRRRRWPLYSGIVVVLLVILWVGYWFAATRITEIAIDRVISAPVAGMSLGCPDRVLSGFPLFIDFQCQRATVSDPQAGLNASLGGFRASAPLYLPGSIEATLDSPLQVNAPARGLAMTVGWSSAAAGGGIWLDGVTRVEGRFTGLAIDNGGRGELLPVRSLAANSAGAGIASAGQGDYRVSVSAERTNVKLTDGTALPEFDARGNLVAVNVGALGIDPAAALLKWLRAGANLKIEDFRFASGGTILTASGTLSLSKEGKLNGAILFGFNSIDALKNFVERIKPGSTSGQTAQLGLQTMNQLSKPVSTPDGAMRQTSLTFIDGVIILAFLPLPIDPIPPIKF